MSEPQGGSVTQVEAVGQVGPQVGPQAQSIQSIIEAIEAIEALYEKKRQIVGLAFLRETIMPRHVQFLLQQQRNSGIDFDYSSIRSFALRQHFIQAAMST